MWKQTNIYSIAEKFNKQLQVQACTYYFGNEETQKREKRPLLNNKYPGEKIIVTYEETPVLTDDNGIKIVNYKDFLTMI